MLILCMLASVTAEMGSWLGNPMQYNYVCMCGVVFFGCVFILLGFLFFFKFQ